MPIGLRYKKLEGKTARKVTFGETPSIRQGISGSHQTLGVARQHPLRVSVHFSSRSCEAFQSYGLKTRAKAHFSTSKGQISVKLRGFFFFFFQSLSLREWPWKFLVTRSDLDRAKGVFSCQFRLRAALGGVHKRASFGVIWPSAPSLRAESAANLAPPYKRRGLNCKTTGPVWTSKLLCLKELGP